MSDLLSDCFEFVSTGTSDAPRLALYGNEWGLSELPQRPSPETWSLDQCLEKLVAAGFDGCQARVENADRVRSFGLRFMTSARINLPGDASAIVARAADAGADLITVHAGWGREDDDALDRFADALQETSIRWKIPVLPETHRATGFQDIWRTLRALERRPFLRLNGDFSHYYCGQEMLYEGFDQVLPSLKPILDRCRCLHGRISNGQSMQIDVGEGTDNPHAENFVRLWAQVFGAWKQQARPGDIFPFAPELGPPSSGYSITHRGEDGVLRELSDRWQQTLVLKRLAEEAFQRANPGQ